MTWSVGSWASVVRGLALLAVCASATVPARAQVSEVVFVRPAASHYTSDSGFQVAAGTDEGDDIAFTSLSPTICTVGPAYYNAPGMGVQASIYYQAADVTITGVPGLCSIAASGAGHFGLVPPAPVMIDSLVVLFDNARITSPNQATFTQGSPMTFTFATGPVTSPTYSLDPLSNLPAGLAFNAATATISGTPSAGGSFAFTFSLSEGGLLAAAQSFTLNLTYLLTPQAITVQSANFGPRAIADGPFDVRASADSFLPLTFTSLTPAVCTVGPTQYTTLSIYYDFATVTPTGTVGTCRIAVDSPADVSHTAAPTVVVSGDIGSGQALNVVRNGPGAVLTITNEINCGSLCTAIFPAGTTVGLIAIPQPPAVFIGWQGACSGSGPCNVLMDASKGVTAVFGTVPVITSANHVTFVVGAANTFTAAAAGTPAPALALSGALPSGVGFNAVTGILAGTPAIGTVGVYSLSLTAANGALPDAAQSLMLTVAKADQAITFANPGTRAFSVVPMALTASASSGLDVSFGSTTPAVCSMGLGGLVMHASGLCNVTADQAGDGTFNAAPQVQRSFIITSGGGAPTITSADHATFTINTAGTFTVTASGSPAPALSIVGTPPSGVTFNATTGVLAGIPALGTAGVHSLTFNATSTTLPNASQAFTLTVAKAAQAITFANPGPQTASGTPLVITAIASSGLAVAFTSLTPQVCTIAGAQLTLHESGICTIAANQAGDANFDAAAQVQQSFATSTPPRLGNISTRMPVLTGGNVMIAGFIIGGSSDKTVAITATGPSLAPFGIANFLANPQITLVRSSDQATIATNDDWQADANHALLQASGFAPGDPLEPGLYVTLPPGAYTAIVSGKNGGTGVSVVGVFEVDHPEVPLVNISTRGFVQTGGDVMIGGFIIDGSAPQTLAVTATGPSLAPFGIANFLANPTLTIVRSSDQSIVAVNDDWQADPNHAALQASGFAPGDPLEPGVLLTLQPGAYTAIVSGVGGGTGVAVIGVFTVP